MYLLDPSVANRCLPASPWLCSDGLWKNLGTCLWGWKGAHLYCQLSVGPRWLSSFNSPCWRSKLMSEEVLELGGQIHPALCASSWLYSRKLRGPSTLFLERLPIHSADRSIPQGWVQDFPGISTFSWFLSLGSITISVTFYFYFSFYCLDFSVSTLVFSSPNLLHIIA